MATFVGLDIGTRTITGAVFTGTPKRYRLKDFFVQDIPAPHVHPEEEAPPPLPALIQNLLSERGLQGADVIAGVDAKDSIIREIIVPFTKDEHIRKTIHSEAEDHFQTFDIDDVQLEFYKLEELEDKSRVLIAAVKNNAIQERLNVLKEGGVDPISLDLDAAALFNAFALTPTFDPDRSTLLIDMGATSSKVLLVEKGQLKKIRSIRLSAISQPSRLIPHPAVAGAVAGGAGIGGSALSETDSYSIESRFAEIENALRWLEPGGGEEAEHLAENAGEEPIAILTDEEFLRVQSQTENLTAKLAESPPDAERNALPDSGISAESEAPSDEDAAPEIDYGEYLERLGIEIQRTFATAFTTGGVDLVCLTGGMSHREETRRFFTQEFDVETINLDFGDQFPVDIPEETQEEVSRVGAVAVGLAVKELGGDRVGFDFRKNQFRFERKFERVKYPVLALSIIACLVFLQSFFNLYQKSVTMNQLIQDVQKRELEMYSVFFGEKNTSELLYPQASNKKRIWEAQLGVGGANIPIFIPFVRAMDEISMGIQESGAQVQIRNITLKLRTTSVQGRIRADNSNLNLETAETGLGTRLERFFGKPGQIFSAKVGESRDPSGRIKLSLTLTPQQRYLNELNR